MKVSVKVDSRRLQSAFRKFLLYSKRTHPELAKEVGRNFVRRAIAITPPSQGSANTESRRRGENAINADLARVFTGKPRHELELLKELFGDRHVRRALTTKDGRQWLVDYDILEMSFGAMAPFHAGKRLASGRVSRAGAKARDIGRWKSDDRMWVPEDNLKRYRRQLYRRVGILAAGWNAAAEKLGARPPAWIRRHGNSRGTITISLSRGVKIVIVNAVPFAGSVRGLRGRVQKALDWQARALERRVEYFTKKGARAAGFKTSGGGR